MRARFRALAHAPDCAPVIAQPRIQKTGATAIAVASRWGWMARAAGLQTGNGREDFVADGALR